jgi:hypothetical protein
MKWEFTGETKVEFGITLRRIRYPETREEGGWIEKESNLSLYGDAQVSGHARVFGHARVSGHARDHSPLFIQGPRDAATNCKKGHIAIGCLIKTFAEWKAEYEQIGKNNGYSAEMIAKYGKIIDLFLEIGE